MDKKYVIKKARQSYRYGLINAQQHKTIRGQALNGNAEGAYKGLKRLLKKYV